MDSDEREVLLLKFTEANRKLMAANEKLDAANARISNLSATVANVNSLVASLNIKYGNFSSKDDEFNGSMVSYNWTVKGGCIQVTYNPNISGEIYITLRYIDNSSQLYVKPNASKKRNMGNDL